MKRIESACLEQTIHFELKEDVDHLEAVAMAESELESYKAALDKKRAKYRIREEHKLPDGSILLKIAKQYNSYECGGYLD